MDQLLRERTYLRSSVTKAINKLKQALESRNTPDIESDFQILNDKADRLFAIDNEIKEDPNGRTLSEEQYEAEWNAVENYREKVVECRSLYSSYHEELRSKIASIVSETSSQHKISGRKFKLPEIRLQKFSGNVKEWLPFWGQFQRIHSDTDLEDIDKFQYLLQSMEPKSKAHELVSTFPLTSENYNIVLEELKLRFARDEFLIDAYIRDIIHLIMASEKGRHLNGLVNSLESSLKSLEVLGVTSDKYAYMLYPLVESALPIEILKVWERAISTNKQDRNLKMLMEFLRNEVTSEERIKLAKVGFLKEPAKNIKSQGETDIKKDEKEFYTAASLVVGEGRNKISF